jgi:hypothetical protein
LPTFAAFRTEPTPSTIVHQDAEPDRGDHRDAEE